MTNQSLLYDFLWKENIGTIVVHHLENKKMMHFYESDFEKLGKLGLLFDVMNGGLVLGNAHEIGGIKMIKVLDKPELEGVFIAEMEGGEFVSPPIVSEEMKTELERINNDKRDNINEKFVVPKNCRVIDLSGIQFGFVLFHPNTQMVINKISTSHNIEELMIVNEKYCG